MNDILKKRLLSLLWRTGAMCAVVILNQIVLVIGDFGLPVWAVAIIGLSAGELTKWLNSTYQIGARVLGKA